MTEWEKKFFLKIKAACNDYLEGLIPLDVFQHIIYANYRNWENDISDETKKNINNLDSRVEHSRFMYDEPERSIEIKKAITQALAYINKVVPEIDKI